MELKVLGAAGGLAQNCPTTAFLLDNRMLFDGGTGVGELSLEQMCAIDTLFLTHAHLDHIAGAALMLASTFDKRSVPLTLVAPADVIEVLRNHLFNWQIWPDFSQLPNDQAPVLKYRTIRVGQPTEINGLSVETVALNHTVPSYAYIVQSEGRSFCFCGDTRSTDQLWQKLNGLGGIDKLFIELSYPAEQAVQAELSGHYDLGSLAEDLTKLDQLGELCLMHAKPGYEEKLKRAVEQRSELQRWRVCQCNPGDRFDVL